MCYKYADFYRAYNRVLRPLVSEMEGRVEYFEEPVLTNITDAFDYMATGNINSAKERLDLCVSHGYQYLIYAIGKDIRKFDRSYSKATLESVDNGHFIGRYSDNKSEALRVLKDAIKQTDMEARESYRIVYERFIDIDEQIRNVTSGMTIFPTIKRQMWMSIIKVMVSIVISVVASIIIKIF